MAEEKPIAGLTSDQYSLLHALSVEVHRNHWANVKGLFDDQHVYFALHTLLEDFKTYHEYLHGKAECQHRSGIVLAEDETKIRCLSCGETVGRKV